MAAAVALAFHTRVEQSASQLRLRRSSLNGTVSSHVFPSTVTFAQVFQFQKIAESEKCSSSSFIGTVSGELILSVNPARAPPSQSKKRRANTSADEASRAICRIKRSGEDSTRISASSYTLAEATLTRLLELKGSAHESIIESWAVSVRNHGQYGAANTPDKRPSLVIAMRMSAGAAVPVSNLVEALKKCTDGMLTVSQESVNSDFDLPLTEQGRESQERGQKSMLLLASIPHVDASAAPDTSSLSSTPSYKYAD